MKVLAIAGSLRRHSYNGALLEAAVELAPSGISIEISRELPELPLFNEDLEGGGGPEPVRRLRNQIAAADGVLIATPEYNQSIPGVLKNALDWLSRPAPEEVLVGKPVAVIGASAGPWGTRLAQAATRQVLVATESLILPGSALYLREAQRLVDSAGRLVDTSTRERLQKLLAAFGHWIRLNAAAGRTATTPSS